MIDRQVDMDCHKDQQLKKKKKKKTKPKTKTSNNSWGGGYISVDKSDMQAYSHITWVFHIFSLY